MSQLSVKKPFTVIVGVIIVLILGIQAYTKLSTDLLPDMELPYAIVMTTYGGASPEQVESVVTAPIESSMATISNIKNVTSTSAENYSMVVLEFNTDTNMDSVTVDMRESLDMLKSYWPDTVGSPIIMKLNPDMMPVMMMAVDEDDLSIEDISDFVNDTLSDEMQAVDGVASVTVSGSVESSLQVVLNDEKIQALNEKLMGKLDDKFDEAQQQIDSSQAAIDSASAALSAQATSGTQQLLDGASAIVDGKLQLAQTEAELKQQLSSLESAGSTLDTKEAELQAQKQQLENNESNLLKLESALSELYTQKEEAKSKLDTLNSALEELKAQAAASPDPSSFDAQIEALSAQVTAADGALKLIEAGISAMESQGVSIGGTEAAKQQIAAGQAVIDQSRTQISQGKAQINAALEQLAAGKETLSGQESALNAAQAAASVQIGSAQSQITSGGQALTDAQSQLDSSEETAKDSADLNQMITADMVKTLLTAQNFSMPAGYVTEDGTDYLVRIGDTLGSQEELEKLVLFDLSDYDLGTITLKDVADVALISNANEVYTRINGNPGIIVSLEKQTGYSTADVAANIREYMSGAENKYEGLHMTALMDQGIYIDQVVDSVLNNLIVGAILAAIILLIFLKDIKPTATVALSIPVSVIFALALMYFSGVTMNIISLSGLALGVGMLVDNAIVVIENIYRLRNEGMPAKEAAVVGAKQVTGAIIASTLTTICIWAPIIFAEGITKQLFVDLVLTIAYSLMASLIVALTVVPMVSSRLLEKQKEIRHPLFDRITGFYGEMLKRALVHKILVIIGTLVLLCTSTGLLLNRGFEFMGETDSTQLTVSVTMPEGSLLEDTVSRADTIADSIESIEDVDTVGAMLGSSLSMMSSYGGADTEAVSMYVLLKEDRKMTSQEVAAKISELTQDMDCEVAVASSSMDMSALGGSGVSVMIKGDDIDTLKSVATDVAGMVSEIDGTIEVSDGQADPVKEIRVTVDKDKAMENGLTVAQVYQEIYNYTAEPKSSMTLTTGNQSMDVIVMDGEKMDLTPEDIRDYVLHVTKQDGTEKDVKLTDIADISEAEGLTAVTRDSQQRYLTVSAGIDENHNATLISNSLEEKLKGYDFPEGYTYEMSGENTTVMESMTELVKLLLLGIVIMYLIMVAQFQSFVSPFIVLFTIPLAFTGGFLGLLLTGHIISVIAMVGFVMLCGIIVNNGIVFIDYTNQLREQGMELNESLIETGKTRLRPILMTALTTILAMTTMALGIGDGTDMVQPMAIVTIGGLTYGTVLTLFVVPVIYAIIHSHKKHRTVKIQDDIKEPDML